METEKKYERTIFLLRRDFRLVDNVGLSKAYQESKEVVQVFVFDERQCVKENNPYFGHSTVEFMVHGLELLDKDLRCFGSRLYYFCGSYPTIIDKLFLEVKAQAVYVNEDFTPFSIKRDLEIKSRSELKNIDFHSYNDIMLVEKGKIKKKDGPFFSDFIPYYMEASTYPIDRPTSDTLKNFISGDALFPSEFKGNIHDFYEPQEEVTIRAGRHLGLQILENITQFADYAKARAFADKPTTKISPYLKYGNVSIREAYWKIVDVLGKKHDLARQLFWRDFYYNVLLYFPDAIFDAY